MTVCGHTTLDQGSLNSLTQFYFGMFVIDKELKSVVELLKIFVIKSFNPFLSGIFNIIVNKFVNL